MENKRNILWIHFNIHTYMLTESSLKKWQIYAVFTVL
jgi:hypothetical protein